MKSLGFDFSFSESGILIVDLSLLHKDVVSKKAEIIIMIEIWALWWEVIYKNLEQVINIYYFY